MAQGPLSPFSVEVKNIIQEYLKQNNYSFLCLQVAQKVRYVAINCIIATRFRSYSYACMYSWRIQWMKVMWYRKCPTLACTIQGLWAGRFKIQYRPRWFQDFPAILLAVPCEINGAYLRIYYLPIDNIVSQEKVFHVNKIFSKKNHRPMWFHYNITFVCNGFGGHNVEWLRIPTNTHPALETALYMSSNYHMG